MSMPHGNRFGTAPRRSPLPRPSRPPSWGVTLLALLCLALGFQNSPASTLFALVDTGEIFVSADEAATWEVRAALTVSDAVGLVAIGSSADLYLVTEAGIVYSSTDAGFAWEPVGAAPSSDIVAVSARTDGGLLLLGRGGTVWESLDEGASFQALAVLQASNHVALIAGEANHYAATATGEVSRSLDGGLSWEFMGAANVSNGVALASSGSSVLFLTESGDILESADEGASWQPVGTLSQVHSNSLISAADGTLYAAVREGEVATSVDGTTWTWVGTTSQVNVVALASDQPLSSVPDMPGGHPTRSLIRGAPWPNPLAGSRTTLTLPVYAEADQLVRLAIIDVTGRRVASLPVYSLTSGSTRVQMDVGHLPSGQFRAQLSVAGGASVSVPWTRLR